MNEGLNKEKGYYISNRIEENDQSKDICIELEKLVKEKGFRANIDLGVRGGEFGGDFLRFHTDERGEISGGVIRLLPDLSSSYGKYVLLRRMNEICKKAGVEIKVYQKEDRARGGGDIQKGNLDEYLKTIEK